MKQFYIVCDVSLCHDCNNCFMACKDEHVGNEWPPYTNAQPRHGHRWIDILRKERGQYPRIDVAYLPVPCQHCKDAACIRAHPDCISRSADGIVQIDIEKAKGNESLAKACPYGAIYWNADSLVAQKCTLCAHILQGGNWEMKTPRCVHSCPTGALEFFHIESEEMIAKIKEEGLELLKPELSGGAASVYYKNLYRFERIFIAGGLLKGGECAEGTIVKLSGEGVAYEQETDCFGDFKFDNLLPGIYSLNIENTEELIYDINESYNIGSITL